MVKKRIYGVEVEYGYTLSRFPDSCGPENEQGRQRFASDYLQILFGREELPSANRKYMNHYWQNGARVYIDRSHPECATPECSTPREAVLYEKAGERIIAGILSYDPRRKKPILFKTNLDRFGKETFGCHENYSMDRGLKSRPDDWQPMLLPFLVTRTIFCGSGFLTSSGFIISQRSLHLVEGMKATSGTNAVPLVSGRNEDLSGPQDSPYEYARLHVVVGDSNLSEISSFLKLGTTGIILEMLEDGFIDSRAVAISEPEETLRQIARDLSLTRKLVKMEATGEMISAIDHQRIYMNLAKAYFETHPEKLDDDTQCILALWEDVLQRLEKDPRLPKRELDWVIKKNFLDYEIKRLGHSWQDWDRVSVDDFWRLKGFDLAYHKIGKGSLYEYLLSKGKVQRILSDGQIERATRRPPRLTRARVRGSFIRWALKCGISVEADWESINGGNLMKYALGSSVLPTHDPFNSYHPGLVRFMKEFRNKDKRDQLLEVESQAGTL